jgi:hypothetical protein
LQLAFLLTREGLNNFIIKELICYEIRKSPRQISRGIAVRS